jgi:hypothetical protein
MKAEMKLDLVSIIPQLSYTKLLIELYVVRSWPVSQPALENGARRMNSQAPQTIISHMPQPTASQPAPGTNSQATRMHIQNERQSAIVQSGVLDTNGQATQMWTFKYKSISQPALQQPPETNGLATHTQDLNPPRPAVLPGKCIFLSEFENAKLKSLRRSSTHWLEKYEVQQLRC